MKVVAYTQRGFTLIQLGFVLALSTDLFLVSHFTKAEYCQGGCASDDAPRRYTATVTLKGPDGVNITGAIDLSFGVLNRCQPEETVVDTCP